MKTARDIGLGRYTASQLAEMVLPIVEPHETDDLEEFGLRFDARRAVLELARRAEGKVRARVQSVA